MDINDLDIYEILDTGIEMDDDSRQYWDENKDNILKSGHTTLGMLHFLQTKDCKLTASFMNLSKDTQTIEESKVEMLQWAVWRQSEGQPDILIADAIRCGSTAEEVVAVLGEPTEIKETPEDLDGEVDYIYVFRHRNKFADFYIDRNVGVWQFIVGTN